MKPALAAAALAGLGACGSAPQPAGEAAAVPIVAPAASAALVASGDQPAATAILLPEAASGWTPKPGWQARRQMVAAAHPLAADAGLALLRAGGSALDAAIAAQMVLGLVEPQSSGVGGGALLLHWQGPAPGRLQAWDGRETAPAAALAGQFLDAQGRPLPLLQAAFGGRAVATPGLVRMLHAAHQVHGQLPWAAVLQPAITLAEQGFEISPRLHAALRNDPLLRRDAAAAAFFYQADGQPHPAGHRLRNPALAAVLRQLAATGADALHQGPVAADLVARVQSHAVPGPLSLADLAAYRPRLREALCTDWRLLWRVCGFGPPSSGHLAVMQMLGMLALLEREPPAAANLPEPPAAAGAPGWLDAAWLHRYAEAARLAFADRAQYVADPAFVPAPAGRWGSLLDESYLRQRAALIGPRSMGRASPGQPGGSPQVWAPMPDQVEQGTTHISVVDAQGRAVALTSTIETAFGARILADGGTGLPGGYLLNNQMTDFAFTPNDAQGRPVANRIEPGKRPRSSMSPTLVFDRRSGELLMTLGSPGGPAIIHYTAKTLLATLQGGLDVQRAIDLPNFGSFNGPTVLEAGRFSQALVQALRARGHEVQEIDLNSGLQAIQRTPQGWSGGADPRREGVVRGD